MDTVECVPLDFDCNTIEPFKLQLETEKIHYNTFWATKSGSKRALQYWVYCESNHDNFLNFNLIVPGYNLDSRSTTIMTDENGVLYFVENESNNIKNVFPIISSSPRTNLNLNNLSPVDYRKFTIKMNLVEDEEYPRHPAQELAELVTSTIFLSEIRKRNELFPFRFTFRLNFQGRAEGWFKIQTTLVFEEKIVITQNITEPFMFNNPRLKKLKEHKNYSGKEIKFMILAEMSGNKQKFLEHYGYVHDNAEQLLSKSSSLFPSVRKKKKN